MIDFTFPFTEYGYTDTDYSVYEIAVLLVSFWIRNRLSSILFDRMIFILVWFFSAFACSFFVIIVCNVFTHVQYIFVSSRSVNDDLMSHPNQQSLVMYLILVCGITHTITAARSFYFRRRLHIESAKWWLVGTFGLLAGYSAVKDRSRSRTRMLRRWLLLSTPVALPSSLNFVPR